MSQSIFNFRHSESNSGLSGNVGIKSCHTLGCRSRGHQEFLCDRRSFVSVFVLLPLDSNGEERKVQGCDPLLASPTLGTYVESTCARVARDPSCFRMIALQEK